jgi:hypothetical protein
MMSRHTRTHHPQPNPPAPPILRNPEPQRHDATGTTRPTSHTAPAKIGDARSQANLTNPAAPPHRLSSEEQFQLTQMRAYCLWEQAGRPDGDAARENFWFQAEREVAAPPPDGR